MEENSLKRLKPLEASEQEKTLQETKLRQQIKTQFRKELSDIKGMDIIKVPWTRKVPSARMDNVILEMINQEIGEVIEESPPMFWKDIAQVLQAYQHCYESLTKKGKVDSKWKVNISEKADKAKLSKLFLEKALSWEQKLLPAEVT